MYKLRRYFPPTTPGTATGGPLVLMVHPMMMSADMWTSPEDGAVGILARQHGPGSLGHRLRLT